MSSTIQSNLSAFCEQQQIAPNHFGAICTLIYITRRARHLGLPLRLDQLASRRGGQVAGLHQKAVRRVLDEYGVAYDPLGEAGRTNPSSLAHAVVYAFLLNEWPSLDRQSLAAIECWWVEHLPSRPDAGAFRLHWRPNHSVRWSVSELFAQMNRRAAGDAAAEQKAWIAGMAAALLSLPLPVDNQSESLPRFEIIHANGDLQVTGADSVFFVTYFPSSSLLDSIRPHLRRRKRKLIVTLDQHTPVINQVLDEANLSRFIDVLGIEQWLAVHLYGAGGHSTDEGQRRIEAIVEQYRQWRELFPLLPKIILRLK